MALEKIREKRKKRVYLQINADGRRLKKEEIEGI